jgi:hypothetical protein
VAGRTAGMSTERVLLIVILACLAILLIFAVLNVL